MDLLSSTLPNPDPATDKWGRQVNAILLAHEAALNTLIALANAQTGGIVLYDGSAWPVFPAGESVVFVSGAYPDAPPPPITAGPGSLWLGVAAS